MKTRLRIDWLLVAPVVILTIISLTTLFSINTSYFRSQLMSLVIGALAFFIFSRINIDFLKQIKLPLYSTALILLSVVFLIGIESRGAVRWIDVFGIRLQFSEILKPFLAICFSSFLVETNHSRKKTFLVALACLLPILLLIYLQPDLGSALIYALVALFVLVVMGFPLYWFGLASLPFVLALPFIWTMLHAYQRQRVLTFLHPSTDPLGTSYNSIQAMIAVGSGAFIGKGWFQGTQSLLRFLPERHTDFIFATISEELGFLGATVIILTFVYLCYRVYQIFRHADDQFSKVFAACCFGFFLIQGFVNIGMNVGLLPIVGVTLPFVSFGGSSLLANCIFLGILSSLSTSQKTKHVLEIR